MKRYKVMFFTGVISIMTAILVIFTLLLDGWVDFMGFVELKVVIILVLLLLGIPFCIIGNENMFYE